MKSSGGNAWWLFGGSVTSSGFFNKSLDDCPHQTKYFQKTIDLTHYSNTINKIYENTLHTIKTTPKFKHGC